MTLIAISGVDGSGKSTQIELLAQALTKQGTRVTVRWFRPGYSPQAEMLKRLLRMPSAAGSNACGDERGAEALRRDSAMNRPSIRLAWLLFAGIDSLIEMGVVARVLARKRTVIYDRWELDAMLDLHINFADWPRVVGAIEKAVGAVKRTPDESVLLMVPRETTLRRLAGKYEPFPDTEYAAKQRRERYDEYAQRCPHLVVNGTNPPDVVHQALSRRIADATA